MTSFNSKEKPPHIQRYDALCERFGEIAEVACENHKTSELLFAHLQVFAHTHDMSFPTKGTTLKLITHQRPIWGIRLHKEIIPSMTASTEIFIALYQLQERDDIHLKD